MPISRQDAWPARAGDGLIERPLAARTELIVAHSQDRSSPFGRNRGAADYQFQGAYVLQEIRPGNPKLHVRAVGWRIVGYETDRAAAQIDRVARTKQHGTAPPVAESQLHFILVASVAAAVSVDDFSPAHNLLTQSSAVLGIPASPARTQDGIPYASSATGTFSTFIPQSTGSYSPSSVLWATVRFSTICLEQKRGYYLCLLYKES